MRRADQKFYRGKTLVITGASSGIGEDLADYLAGAGVKLALVARREERLVALAQRVEAAGSTALVVAADVADRGTMEAARDRVLEVFGPPDIVVANAGTGGLNPATAFDLDVHRKTVEVNLLGIAHTLMPYVPSMMARGRGQLVGISSLAAFRGLPKGASYSSTKAAQAVFLESLRVDLRPHGIRVSSIHPGFIETAMTAHDDFTMPFMMPVRKSTLLVAAAIRKGHSSYLYPWQMRYLTWLNRMLPNWLFDRVLPRMSGQKDDVTAKLM